ncbi:MAG: metal ABC transporter substrate-binding protein [Candidatus Hinthialibacter antarcticus]|nr:metal ABC transporter substrate-binding protein [Candidatus Hinthialibacter antarcticus]
MKYERYPLTIEKMIKQLYLSILFALVSFPVVAKPQYVATIQPLASVLKQIVGEQADVDRLLPGGASPHTYEPRPSDMKKAHNALALFFVSNELDGWAKRLTTKPAIQAIDYLPKSFQLEPLEEDHHDHDHDHGVVDPHFWLDPLSVKAVVPGLLKALQQCETELKPEYTTQSEQLIAELDSLHQWIEKTLAPLQGKSVLLTHSAFQYYLKRYGIKIAGVIEASPGKTPSPKRIKQLIDLVREQDVSAILTEPQLSNSPARVLAESVGVKLIEVDPLGGVEGRLTYQDLLRYNTKKLLEALQ